MCSEAADDLLGRYCIIFKKLHPELKVTVLILCFLR